MIDAQITVSDAAVKRALGDLRGKSGVVISRAANRAATTANKVIQDETKKRYLATKASMQKALFKRKATAASPTAALIYRSSRENVYKWRGAVSPTYVVKRSAPPKPNPRYYSVRVMRSHGPIPMIGSPKPFVQRMKNGHVGLFRRKSTDERKKGDKRNAIKSVDAPALSQILKNKETLDYMREKAGAAFVKNLEHEIDYLLKK